jgi:hypothetical protein
MKWNDEVDMIVGQVDKATGWCESSINGAAKEKDCGTLKGI